MTTEASNAAIIAEAVRKARAARAQGERTVGLCDDDGEWHWYTLGPEPIPETTERIDTRVRHLMHGASPIPPRR